MTCLKGKKMRRVIFFVSANKRTASSLSTNQYFHIIRSIELAIMAVLVLAAVSQVIGAEPEPILPSIPEPVPPPPPVVSPLISETYSHDVDGNRIQDKLELRDVPPLLPAYLRIIEMVDVQLTFSSPITQQQNDDFLAIGGEITYIYDTIS